MSNYFGSYFGDAGASACDYPAATDVRDGISYGAGVYTGSYVCPGQTGTEPTGPHSPADVVRYLLVNLGIAAYPPNTPWPAYTATEPTAPDAVITAYDTAAIDDGRLQVTGERVEHYGVQIRIRSVDHATGFAKAKEIADAFDTNVYREAVSINASDYCVHSISRTSSILALGFEQAQGKKLSDRRIFVINLAVSMDYL